MSDTAEQSEPAERAEQERAEAERKQTEQTEQTEQEQEQTAGRAAARAGTAPESARPAGEGAESAEERHRRLRERRVAVHRDARRVLARPGFITTLRERIALLEDAEDLYDLDAPSDMYGNGVVAALEDRTAALLGTEAAAFFPTGTMAQQVALRCWAGRTGNPAVALHGLSHPEVHERHAFERLSGLRPVRLTDEPRPPTADEVRGLEEPFGALMLELPLREPGYLLPTWEELTEVVDAARERDAVVHFDGARLWECTVHFGRPLAEIAGLADSVYVSFYKSLKGYGGGALAGPRTLVEEARAWRHRYGGQVFQQFPTVLSALAGLERELPRLPEYVAHARVVAAALREGFAAAGLPWARVHPGVPHTHEFQVWLPCDPDAAGEAAVRQGEETGTVLFSRSWDAGGPGIARTEVGVEAAGLEWTAEDVRAAVAGFAARLKA
ncbi:threonine aldolase family protein [Streptomyces mayonensis]|uniref:threonine aldolase family protein n=1 Tax=Streptomyces mayonensis TaxID=2750816 RepID=UPI0020A6D9AB|nr:beta-eliminating lyase-related protein [Streptomyces sp. A108]